LKFWDNNSLQVLSPHFLSIYNLWLLSNSTLRNIFERVAMVISYLFIGWKLILWKLIVNINVQLYIFIIQKALRWSWSSQYFKSQIGRKQIILGFKS
jgi:hypothetical protein